MDSDCTSDPYDNSFCCMVGHGFANGAVTYTPAMNCAQKTLEGTTKTIGDVTYTLSCLTSVAFCSE